MAMMRAPDQRRYVTTTEGMSGHFAVLLWWNDKSEQLGGFWEPWNTGAGRYPDQASAEEEAQFMARDEKLLYVRRGDPLPVSLIPKERS
jgi:hypothetical protein